MDAGRSVDNLVLLFIRWERRAIRKGASDEASTSLTVEELSPWLPRLAEIQARLTSNRIDQSAQAEDYYELASIRQLWREWRQDKRAERIGRALSHP
jgi:hypothetical protein